jgi:hypothetical protein
MAVACPVSKIRVKEQPGGYSANAGGCPEAEIETVERTANSIAAARRDERVLLVIVHPCRAVVSISVLPGRGAGKSSEAVVTSPCRPIAW